MVLTWFRYYYILAVENGNLIHRLTPNAQVITMPRPSREKNIAVSENKKLNSCSVEIYSKRKSNREKKTGKMRTNEPSTSIFRMICFILCYIIILYYFSSIFFMNKKDNDLFH